MAGVAAVFLDQVTEEPAQAGMVAVGVGDVHELVESAVGQGRVQPRTGPFDGAVPQRVELVGVSSAAKVNSQSSLPSQPSASHGAPIGSPRSLAVK